MSRKKPKKPTNQPSLFGTETVRDIPEGKEVNNGRQSTSGRTPSESTEVTGTVASVINPDEPIGDTVGDRHSPAGTAVVTSSPTAQPSAGLHSAEGFSLSSGDEPDHVLTPGEMRYSRGGTAYMQFHPPIARRLSNKEWDDLVSRTRSDGSWTDEDIDRCVTFCPDCKRVVWEFFPGRLSDPCPRDREKIVKRLGERFTAFSKRSPMRSLIGTWVRPAHSCTDPVAQPDPKRGWKPGKGHGSEIYDMG